MVRWAERAVARTDAYPADSRDVIHCALARNRGNRASPREEEEERVFHFSRYALSKLGQTFICNGSHDEYTITPRSTNECIKDSVITLPFLSASLSFAIFVGYMPRFSPSLFADFPRARARTSRRNSAPGRRSAPVNFSRYTLEREWLKRTLIWHDRHNRRDYA